MARATDTRQRTTHRRSARGLAVAVISMLAVALATLAGACGDATTPAGDTSPGTAAATPRPPLPKAGGTLTVAYLSQPATLDPALADSAVERTVAHAVHEGLLRYAPLPKSAGVVLVPGLATEVPTRMNGMVSADGRSYTFTVRKGVRFQPPVNRVLTADDVKFSLERAMRAVPNETAELYSVVVGADRFLAGKADAVSGLVVVDAGTLRIRLTRPDPSFLHVLAAHHAHVLPEEWVERWGDDLAEHPLGTGPFVFLKWSAGKEVKLARNPSYWQAGKPYVDALTLDLALEREAALTKLKAGAVDALGHALRPEELRQLSEDAAWERQLHSRSALAGTYLVMNPRVKPFDDVRVRRALSWSIDREKLAELQSGRAEALWQYYPPDLPGHEEGRVFHGHDPARAKAALAKAGFPKGFTTTLSVPDGDLEREGAKALRADLAAVGVRVRLRTLSDEQLARELRRPKGISLASVGWQAAIPDPSAWYASFPSPGGIGVVHELYGFGDRLEAGLREADILTDAAARIQEYQDLQRVLARQTPSIPLYSPVQTSACSRNLEGFYLHPIYQLDLENYWKK